VPFWLLAAIAIACGVLLSEELVPFAVVETITGVTHRQLLPATKLAKHGWRVESASAPLTLLPFTVISDEPFPRIFSLADRPRT
jgi:hypothetical protein